MVFTVPSSKTVPALYPEAPEFQAIPEVLGSEVQRYRIRR